MKIGILTFWGDDNNYGQLLQAFALCSYLESVGHIPEIISYKPRQLIFTEKVKRFFLIGTSRFYSPKKIIFYFKEKSTLNNMNSDLRRGFSTFRTEYLPMSTGQYNTKKEVSGIISKYECLICGSDKIWNRLSSPIINKDSFDVYMMNFNKHDIKLVSYAPSIGINLIYKKNIKLIVPILKKYDAISIREKSGVKTLSNLNIKNVKWVPDPTQLIGAEGYRRFIDSAPTNYQKTWFVYGLNNPSYITSNQIAKELLSKGLDFAYTGANGNTDELINCYPTIPEWLSYMYYADNIITNSYHGCIFCILFHKNFYYVPVLPDKNGLPDERVLSIMNRYEIKDRAIQSLEQLQQIIAHPYKPIEWDSVDAKREEFVQVGKDFLAKHLGDPTT